MSGVKLQIHLLSFEADALAAELRAWGSPLAALVLERLGLARERPAGPHRPWLSLPLEEARRLRDWAQERKAALEPATHAWRAVDSLGALLAVRIMFWRAPRKAAQEGIPRKGLA